MNERIIDIYDYTVNNKNYIISIVKSGATYFVKKVVLERNKIIVLIHNKYKSYE